MFEDWTPGETHYCCDARLKLDGAEAVCCHCYPHIGCDLKAKKLSKFDMEFRNIIDEARAGMGWTQDGAAMVKRLEKLRDDLKK